ILLPVVLTVHHHRGRRMPLSTELVFDPLDLTVWDDPYPLYRQMRDERLYYNPERDFWAISRYADVKAALLDPVHFSSDARTYVELWGSVPARPGTLREAHLAMGRETSNATSLITIDPPENRRLRDIAAPGFGRPAMKMLESAIREVCEGLTDHLIERN